MSKVFSFETGIYRGANMIQVNESGNNCFLFLQSLPHSMPTYLFQKIPVSELFELFALDFLPSAH